MLATEPIRSAVVVAPHADDEALGAGGLISKLVKADVNVLVLFVVVDGFHHYGLERRTTLDEMKSEIKRASSVLGYEHETIYEGMDLIEKLDTVPQRDLVDVFEARLNEHRPDLLLLPHGVDFDQDHVSCYRAAFAAARPIPTALGKHLPGKVLTYESPKLAWSQEPFQPEVYWDITAEIEDKLRAIAAYKTQLRSPPHVRSLDNVRALAHIRGAEIGVVHAEAYNCLRWMP